MKKMEKRVLGLEGNIKNGVLVNNGVDIQVSSPEGVETNRIKLNVSDFDNVKNQVESALDSKYSVVKYTTFFDSQVQRLEEKLQEIKLQQNRSELEKELSFLNDENECLINEAKDIYEDFDPEDELPDEAYDELNSEEIEILEDLSDEYMANSMEIEELSNILKSSLEEIELDEHFCPYKPEVQSKLDDIIRGASFSALYTFFTTYKNVKYSNSDYETKKIMSALSLAFCNFDDEKVDISFTYECYQLLKNMTYELYKAIPGDEIKNK